MEIREIGKDEAKQWDAFIDKSLEAWLFHLHGWGDILEKVYGYKTTYLVAEEKGEIIGAFPLTLRKKILLKWLDSGGTGYGGIATSPSLDETKRKSVTNELLAHTHTLALKNKATWLGIKLPPLATSYLPPKKPYLNPLIEYGFKDIPSYGFILNLECSIDELWNRLGKKTRNIIRKAEKNEIRIVKVQEDFDINIYYNLHKETCKRTGATPFDKEYYSSIWETFGKKGKQQIFLAKQGDRMLAAISIGSYKEGAHYWSGASANDALKFGCNDLLQWHAIKWAKENGFKWYDNGDVYPFSKNKKQHGLYEFKGSFGGELSHYYKGIYIYSPTRKKITDIIKGVLGKGTEM